MRISLRGRVGFGFKTASGEWVDPEHVEALLESSPWVHQALLMPSRRQLPVVVVVPTPAADTSTLLRHIRQWAVHQGLVSVCRLFCHVSRRRL